MRRTTIAAVLILLALAAIGAAFLAPKIAG